MVDKSTQSASASAHEEAREKGVKGAVSVVMNCSTSGMVNAVQQGSEGNGIDHIGLGKERVGTMEDQGSHIFASAQADQPITLADTSSKMPGPTLLTRAWRRLAREVGKGQKENDEGCMLKTAVNTMDNGKRRMSIDLEDLVESKKQCMNVYEGMDDQSIEVVAAWQHHRAL